MLLLNVFVTIVSWIECSLRCGVALVREFLYWALLTPLWENIFQVLEVHQEVELI